MISDWMSCRIFHVHERIENLGIFEMIYVVRDFAYSYRYE